MLIIVYVLFAFFAWLWWAVIGHGRGLITYIWILTMLALALTLALK